MTPVDMCAEVNCSQRAHDLEALRRDHHLSGLRSNGSNVGATLIKVLAIILAIFASLAVASSFPADLALLAITLIAVLSGTIVMQSRTIAAYFPRNVWASWRNVGYSPPRRRRGTYYRAQNHRVDTSTTWVPHTTVGGGHHRSSPPSAPRQRRVSHSPPSSSTYTRTSSGAVHTGVGARNNRRASPPQSPYTHSPSGSTHVGVGAGHDRRSDTTSSGNVMVGSRS